MVLTCAFTCELVIKLAGFTGSEYATDYFNLFDAAIVIISVSNVVFTYVPPLNNIRHAWAIITTGCTNGHCLPLLTASASATC